MRVALVTGGAGGIGSAICRELAAAGHKVAVADVAFAQAKLLADEIAGMAVELDVTNPASVTVAVQSTGLALGPIEVLVNCAGWGIPRKFSETDEPFQQRVLDINLAGPMRVTREILVPMQRRGWGRLINIASDAGRVASTFEAIYSGAKGGLIAFTRTIAREVAADGVTANVICPGPTDTPLLDAAIESTLEAKRAVAKMCGAIPVGRLGRPEDIAPAVAFLVSDQASFITGQTLSVNGGFVML
jgi:2-hydroxycyclohexanecarboxyl-CoA dehydrogenase